MGKYTASNKQRLSTVMPEFARSVQLALDQAEKEGISATIGFDGGYRSHAEQTKLFAKGRTAPGKVVTNAKAGQSLHNYGLAVDIYVVEGQKIVSHTHPKAKRLVQLMKAQKLEWGGDWVNFQDYPHFQLTGGIKLATFQQLYRTGGLAACWDAVTARTK